MIILLNKFTHCALIITIFIALNAYSGHIACLTPQQIEQAVKKLPQTLSNIEQKKSFVFLNENEKVVFLDQIEAQGVSALVNEETVKVAKTLFRLTVIQHARPDDQKFKTKMTHYINSLPRLLFFKAFIVMQLFQKQLLEA